MIKYIQMESKNTIFPTHTCQHCGSEIKLVETIIDDEFIWDESLNKYVPNSFTDQFAHTGVERCAKCDKDWTGDREKV